MSLSARCRELSAQLDRSAAASVAAPASLKLLPHTCSAVSVLFTRRSSATCSAPAGPRPLRFSRSVRSERFCCSAPGSAWTPHGPMALLSRSSAVRYWLCLRLCPSAIAPNVPTSELTRSSERSVVFVRSAVAIAAAPSALIGFQRMHSACKAPSLLLASALTISVTQSKLSKLSSSSTVRSFWFDAAQVSSNPSSAAHRFSTKVCATPSICSGVPPVLPLTIKPPSPSVSKSFWLSLFRKRACKLATSLSVRRLSTPADGCSCLDRLHGLSALD
mmetsp:Transcript_32729/g.78198  ORF Transcript_32729/g.78198 Transcript_32729/m.78198 type:complete len:275 (-) Transcript_32729:389-1213(-)